MWYSYSLTSFSDIGLDWMASKWRICPRLVYQFSDLWSMTRSAVAYWLGGPPRDWRTFPISWLGIRLPPWIERKKHFRMPLFHFCFIFPPLALISVRTRLVSEWSFQCVKIYLKGKSLGFLCKNVREQFCPEARPWLCLIFSPIKK